MTTLTNNLRNLKIFSFFTMFLLIVILLVGFVVSQGYYSEPVASESPVIQLPSFDNSKFESKIIDELYYGGFVSVIVELKDNGILLERNPEKDVFFEVDDLPEIREQIAANQEVVLLTLNGYDFVLNYKYNVVNAFAGDVSLEGLEKLSMHPLVEFISLSRTFHTSLVQSVPLINADVVHELSDIDGLDIRGKGQVVCVLDTGIDYTHDDLGGCFGEGCRVIGGYDFVDGDDDPMDGNTHGTYVAGVIAADGNVRGVAPDAELLAVRVCDDNLDCSGDDILAGLDWCIDNKDIFNTTIFTMSIADDGEYDQNTCLKRHDKAIDMAYSFDILTTVSSGNNGFTQGISYPSCIENTISVGAVYDADIGSRKKCLDDDCIRECTDSTTAADKIACYSNSGGSLDVVAPGALIRTTELGGFYKSVSGTSFAAPHVAGVIALMKQSNHSLNVNDIELNLKENGVIVVDERNGLSFPRVDALASLMFVDFDEDGYYSQLDCDDHDFNINPGVTEVCNGVDDNCDNIVDETGDSLCDDDLFCNGEEICNGSFGCLGGSMIVNDGVECTLDSCDEVNDEIIHSTNNDLCNDGNICTVSLCDVNLGCRSENLEDGTSLEGICGVGECLSHAQCLDGGEVCMPGEPSDEICDDLDNDCDGLVDEGDVCGVVNVEFIRGDSNSDGVVDISDVITTLNYVFLGDTEISCLDSADANDDGQLDISDPVTTLGFVFLGDPKELPQPHKILGVDPTEDNLNCKSYDI